MSNELESIIKERIDKLPAEIVSAIRNALWIEKVNNIAKINKLNVEKERLFVTETTLLVLGITSPKTYPMNLAENVGLDDDTVIKIAKEVDKQIITPIIRAVEKNVSNKKSFVAETPSTPEKPGSTAEPIIITKDTKEQAMKELQNRRINVENGIHYVPEVPPPHNLPMVEPEEFVHEVPHDQKLDKVDMFNKEVEKPKLVQTPNYGYSKGKDPYREPLK